ncbi:hypothetical protein Val02_68630 [Virgisporangium aliadipatigenens]|uniref:AB hydrolase-1 domain-containing protein n=1 Tax=Virgisporangium aliadipatigenens TaxID=741659 RepID=A0A8J4DVB5_9ACTN|nr:alpha/beta hydrolase [Virgisporangium aliadipatigenens]GIJ49977.1 hypothetical protein Val02_68630 [Virgisporangium aliadipatigenens]
MTTYVLVPGFFLGGWAWRDVAAHLRARGHEAHPVTLTGLGERAHLARPDVDLDTHIDDVAHLLRYRELRDVTLVGHSYGGEVVTGVADRLPHLVSRLVYVDTGPLPDGVSQNDFARSAGAPQEPTDGFLPPPPWASVSEGEDGVDLARLSSLATPQPWATATAPVRLTGAWEKIPCHGVFSSFTVEQVRAMAATVPFFRLMVGPQWTYAELPGWHWPLLNRAAELSVLLEG